MISSSFKSSSTFKLTIVLTLLLTLISCEVNNDHALNCEISKLERIIGDQELIRKSDSLCHYLSITEENFIDNSYIHKKYLEKLDYLKTLKLSSLLHPEIIQKHLQPLKTEYSNDSLNKHNSLPAKLILSHDAIHFGDFNESDTVYKEFTLTNTSRRKVDIKGFIHQYVNIHTNKSIIEPKEKLQIGISYSPYLNGMDWLTPVTELDETVFIRNNSNDSLISIKISGKLFYPADTNLWKPYDTYFSHHKYSFYSSFVDSSQINLSTNKNNVYKISAQYWKKKGLSDNIKIPWKAEFWEYERVAIKRWKMDSLESYLLAEKKELERQENERKELEKFLKSPKNTYTSAERFMKYRCSQINHIFLRGSSTDVGYVFLTMEPQTGKCCISIIIEGASDIESVACHEPNTAVHFWNQITGDIIYL